MFSKAKLILSNVLNRGEKLYNTFIVTLMLMMSAAPAYAGQPTIVTGTVNLFKAFTTWLLVIIPVGAGAMLGYQALQKSLSDDQAIIAEKNRFMKNVLIGAIVAECASGLVTVILGFYAG